MGQAFERSKPHLPDCLAAAGVVGAWTHDTASDRVIADRDVSRLFGVVRSEPGAGVPFAAYVEAIHPADRGAVAAEVDRAVRSGAPIALQYRVRTSGGVRWLRDYGSFTLDERGCPSRGQGIVIDATCTMIGSAPEVVTELSASGVAPTGMSDDIIVLAEHVLAASEISRAIPSTRLRALTDPLLWEVGRLLAWVMSTHKP